MAGTYDPWLVLLSVIVAVNASFVALSLASRLAAARGRRVEWFWLAGGAMSMGAGIWSTHFIGMLAFRRLISTEYDVRITLLSLLIAVLASGIALFVASRSTLSVERLLGAGLLMGFGIASMHYVGMAAMRMQPPISYAPGGVALSVLIAVAASMVTVWSAFRLRLETVLTALGKKAGSALAMAGGICGMHYTAIAAASFAPGSVCAVAPQHFDNASMGTALGALVLLFLVLTLFLCACDARNAASLETMVAERTGSLNRVSSDLRRALRHVADLQDEERRRLAAELHDIVGQNLSALSVEVAMARDQLDPATGAGLIERLGRASTLARQSVEAVRNVMAELRPPGLDELGLAAALRWHAERLQSRTGISIRLQLDEALPRPSAAVEDALLRVTVEALCNAAKYSGARAIQVRLEGRADTIALDVADDGGGFDADNQAARTESSGWGLTIMKERALAVGAELRVLSAPGAGTRVEFLILRAKWQ
jgi:NO-binding membrane sensor protein with MHYT domain/two-component sensor histidine kinase